MTARRAAARRALSGEGLPIRPRARVGLFGGSFDPPHAGHAHVARTALRRLGLDQVIWLVSPGNPLKTRTPADTRSRLEAIRSLAGERRMIASDIERRLGLRYSADLIRWLRLRHPNARFVWIMGADNLAGFSRWRDWAGILRTVPVAVVARPGHPRGGGLAPSFGRFRSARLPASAARRLALARPPAWIFLPAPLKSVSSTALRAAHGRAAN